MTYEETPMRILDKKDQVLRNNSISLVKITQYKRFHGNWKKACVTNTLIYLCKFMIEALFYGCSIYDNIV
jgi:hypothetical protein